MLYLKQKGISWKKDYMCSQFLYTQFMLILKTWICSNKIDTLEKNLSLPEFSVFNVPFHPEETLDECSNLNPDEPSWVEVHNMHTHLPPASTRYIKVPLRVVCINTENNIACINVYWKCTVQVGRSGRKRCNIK